MSVVFAHLGISHHSLHVYIMAPALQSGIHLPKKAAVFLNVLLWIAVIGDFSFNFAYLLIEKRHFELIFQMIFRNF